MPGVAVEAFSTADVADAIATTATSSAGTFTLVIPVDCTIADSQLDLKVLATPLTSDTHSVPSTVALSVKQDDVVLHRRELPDFDRDGQQHHANMGDAVVALHTDRQSRSDSRSGVDGDSDTWMVAHCGVGSGPFDRAGGTLNITVNTVDQKTNTTVVVDDATVSVAPVDTAVTATAATPAPSASQASPTTTGRLRLTATKSTTTTAADGSAVTTKQTGTAHVSVGTTAKSVAITIETVP